jgi:putative hydrolase of the HAD superfamily
MTERPVPALDHVRVWIFDLDNTLYPSHCDLFSQVDRRIGEYIARLMSVPADEARWLQKNYFRRYGTTMRGLMTEYGIDPAEFLDFVHRIDHAPVQPAPALGRALDALPGRKFVFTNASAAHAGAVLARLELADRFEGVFDIIAANFVPKPDEAFYEGFLRRFGIDPRDAVLFDDMARNLEPAHRRGMTTVLIETDNVYCMEGHDRPHVQHRTRALEDWLAAVVAARAARPAARAEPAGAAAG